jgi:MFS family permease
MKAWNKKVEQLGLLPWITWFVAALFYLYEYFLQVSPNVMTHDLMSAFHINGTYLGYLGGIYFVSYAAMQIPVGLLLDYIGPRKALTIATFVCMVGCFLFGMTHSFSQALLARLFLGFGSAFAIVSCLKIVASWFPLNRFAVLSGLTVTMGTLGGVIGQAPLAMMVERLSWRPTMMILAVFSGIIMFLVILLVRDKPEDDSIHPQHVDSQVKTGVLSGLIKIMKNRQCWLVAIYGGLMFMPTTILGTLWGASYISTAYDIERHVAAGYISMMFFGWLVGSPLFGLISDKLGLRKPPMYMGSIGALVCLITILYFHLPVAWLGFFFFAFGIFSSGFLPSFSIILEINQQK